MQFTERDAAAGSSNSTVGGDTPRVAQALDSVCAPGGDCKCKQGLAAAQLQQHHGTGAVAICNISAGCIYMQREFVRCHLLGVMRPRAAARQTPSHNHNGDNEDNR